MQNKTGTPQIPRVLPDVIKLPHYMRDVGSYHLKGNLLLAHNFKPEKNKSLHNYPGLIRDAEVFLRR